MGGFTSLWPRPRRDRALPLAERVSVPTRTRCSTAQGPPRVGVRCPARHPLPAQAPVTHLGLSPQVQLFKFGEGQIGKLVQAH